MSMNVTLTVPVETMLRVSTIMDPMFVTAQKDGRDMIAKMVMINTIMYLLEGYLRRINIGKGVRSYSNEYSNDHFRC